MSILRSSIIVSGSTLISRVFGFARDMVIANKLGASNASDAFFVAMIVPNLLRRLFAEGAFNVVFVPILSRIHKNQGQQAAERFVSVAMTILALALIAVTILAEIFMPQIIHGLTMGWDVDSNRTDLAITLSRITFPYLALITFASLFGGICNTFGRFAPFALTPVILNIVLIIAFSMAPDDVATAAYHGAIGMIVGGAVQVGFMMYALLNLRFNVRFTTNLEHEEKRPFLRRLGPAALTVGITQVSFLVDTLLASFLADNAVSYLQYANRFYQQPLSLIGIALATVLLPHLSSALKENNKTNANYAFESALLYGSALSIAATIGLIALAYPLIDVMFGHGKFTQEDVLLVSQAMQAYCLAIPALVVTKVTITCFYANEDTKTPVKISVLCMVFNVCCTLVLMQFFGFVGIALSTALTGWVNATIQLWVLRKQNFISLHNASTFKKSVLRMLVVNTAMAIVVAIIVLQMPELESRTLSLVWIVGTSIAGFVVFSALGHALKLFNILRIKDLVLHKK